MAASLDKDVVLAEGEDCPLFLPRYISNINLGYKEYDTGRTHMARIGDWRENKDQEIELDGIGGVNIVVKADVHKSGKDGRIC